MQLICVVEASSKSKTDWIYIKSFINKYYCKVNKIKYSVVYLEGKPKYNKVEKQIANLENKYSNQRGDKAKSLVCYFIDTDYGKEGSNLNPSITKYCQEKGYYLVWFHRDIEEVFLGESVSSNEKTKRSKAFAQNPHFEKNDLKKLTRNNFESRPFKTSNIKSVLDLILKDKK